MKEQRSQPLTQSFFPPISLTSLCVAFLYNLYCQRDVRQLSALLQILSFFSTKLQTLCIRHEPEGLSGEDLDAHTLAWLDQVHKTGRAWLTPAQLDGRWMVRVSIGALTTERQHVEELWRLLQAAVTDN